MNYMIKALTLGTLCLATAEIGASPLKLVTNNTTDVESNAYVAGSIPSRHPTKAHSMSKVPWTEVRMACFGHVVEGKCDALVKMETNTSHPIVLGWVKLDIETGDITPKVLSSNGYTLVANGPGETTLSKDY